MRPSNLKIDGDRLWRSLMEIGEIGGTEKGGCCRLALTDLDAQARDLFISWCQAAGCAVTIDKLGNIFARRPGRDNSLPPVMTGSHLDTVPTGGKFDGILGVMAGLEVMRTLHDMNYTTLAPMELAVWTNEEGSRFSPAMVSSGVFAGVFPPEFMTGRTDKDGKTLGEELKRIGYEGEAPIGGRDIGAFFELHIEQGPILEEERKTIGIVTGTQGMRWYEITLTGQEAHAGTTPMNRRKDALSGAAEFILAVERIANDHGPGGRGTVGYIEASPNGRNVITGAVTLCVDLRHPDDDQLLSMNDALESAIRAIAEARRLDLAFAQIWHSPALDFDPACVGSVRHAAAEAGYEALDIVSGAGHDAVYLARVAPTAMIFVPCEGGISHNEAEYATPEDCAAGCDVLLRVLVEHADRPV
jgi:N-carbamoyl-L-amino-acid hydrolase